MNKKDVSKENRKWTHPAEAIEIKEKCERIEYMIEVYTDGSKNENGVGSGIAIFIDKHLTFQLKYKLADRSSNKQAEQLAVAKALEKMKDLHQLQGNQRYLAIHTDSRILLDTIANPSNHQNFVERNREEIRRLKNDNWIIQITWVKAHDNNGNELAGHLTKRAACGSDVDITYIKIPKSAATNELKEKGAQVWQSERDASNKGQLTKIFFPIVKDRI
jgi:ribonuclease HI